MITVALVCTTAATVTAQVQPDGSFGFLGTHIFKFHRGVGPVSIADLDGDGHQDLAVMDNQKAQLVLLYHDSEAKGSVPEGGRFADPDGFRRQEVLVSQNVTAMAALDLDGDGSTDVALHSPGMIEIRWGGGARPFAERARFRTPDSLAGPESLAVSITHGPEVFLLARRGIHHLSGFSRDRAPDRKFHPGSSQNPLGLFALDLDRDGRRDLLTVVDDKTHPYRLRLATGPKGGESFGPESIIEAAPPVAVTTLERADRTALLAANRERGRFEELELSVERRRDPFDFENPDVHPLDAQGLSQPQFIVSDLDRDGDPDFAITNAGAGTILLLKNDGGQLRSQPPSPTVRNLGSIAAADLNGDGTVEIVVASSEEKVLGVSRLDKSTVTFPKKLADVEAPILAVPGSFTSRDATEIAVLGGSDRKTVTILASSSADAWTARGTFQVETNTDPKDLRAFDVDQDGVDELLVFVPYQAPILYRQVDKEDGPSWSRIDSPGTLETAAATAVTQAKNGDLLIASGNHLRRVKLNGDELEVVYQVNGASGSSQIAVGFEARLQDDQLHLVLIDRGDKTVNIYELGDGQPELQRSVPGPYASIRGGAIADLDGNGRDEVLLVDDRFLVVLESGGERAVLESVFTHQCARENGRYVDLVGGDLNGDGHDDLLVSEGANHFLEIYSASDRHHWKLGLAFPVYESNTFRSVGGTASEPRKVMVADVTGDGRNDAIIVVHDRIIVYPQDE